MSKAIKIESDIDFGTSSQSTPKTGSRRKSSTSPLKFQMESEFVHKLGVERQKLSSVESQQIIAVLDDTLQALEIISRFESVCENYDFFEQFLGPEIAKEFLHLCTALSYETDYDEDFEEKKTAEADAEFVESIKEMSSAQKLTIYATPAMRRIRDTVKTLVRQLIEKRGAYNTVCMDTTPSNSMMELLQAMEELRKFVYERLQTTEVQEKERLLFLENSPMREKLLKQKIDELEGELSQIKSRSGYEVSRLTDKIAQLEDDIEKMVTISSEAILQRRMETFQEVEQEEKNSKEEQIILQAEYQNQQKKYDAMLDKHRNAELNLRKKNFKISVEVENWVLKYDKDMSERLAAYESLLAEYKIEKEKLTKLEAEFDPINKEYNALMEERAEEKRQRLLRIATEEIFINATIVIQKYWRGWLARKRYKARTKKK